MARRSEVPVGSVVRIVVVLGALACGCGDGFDPVGTYEGSAVRSGQVMRQLTDTQPDGTSTANTSRFNRAGDATVVVRRVDDTHLELDIGEGCTLRVRQTRAPNEHQTHVPPSPDQSCRLEVEGFAGDVRMDGSATFSRQEPTTIDIQLSGRARVGPRLRTGDVSVTYNFQFDGRRAAR